MAPVSMVPMITLRSSRVSAVSHFSETIARHMKKWQGSHGRYLPTGRRARQKYRSGTHDVVSTDDRIVPRRWWLYRLVCLEHAATVHTGNQGGSLHVNLVRIYLVSGLPLGDIEPFCEKV